MNVLVIFRFRVFMDKIKYQFHSIAIEMNYHFYLVIVDYFILMIFYYLILLILF